jgi:hypothetical protein
MDETGRHSSSPCATSTGRLELHTKFWLDILKRRDLSEYLGIDRTIILKRS